MADMLAVQKVKSKSQNVTIANLRQKHSIMTVDLIKTKERVEIENQKVRKIQLDCEELRKLEHIQEVEKQHLRDQIEFLEKVKAEYGKHVQKHKQFMDDSERQKRNIVTQIRAEERVVREKEVRDLTVQITKDLRTQIEKEIRTQFEQDMIAEQEQVYAIDAAAVTASVSPTQQIIAPQVPEVLNSPPKTDPSVAVTNVVVSPTVAATTALVVLTTPPPTINKRHGLGGFAGSGGFKNPKKDSETQTTVDEYGLWDKQDGWIFPISGTLIARDRWRKSINFASCPHCKGIDYTIKLLIIIFIFINSNYIHKLSN
jgi:hypothetical protein